MRWLSELRENLQMRWVVFAAGFIFFVVTFGVQDGWDTGMIVIVLTLVGLAATLAVGFDRME